jgi:hypothetical protein
MNIPLPLLIIAGVAWMLSAILVWGLWKSQEPLWFKLLGTLVAAIPFFGPFLFAFFSMPSRLPIHLRQTMNHHGTGGRFLGLGSDRFNYDPVVHSSGNDKPKRERLRSLTKWETIGLTIAFIFLVVYWTKAFHYYVSGNAWGHSNYWGQPVGTFLLIAVLLAGSVAFVAILWRYWLSRLFEEKALLEPKPSKGPTPRSTRTRRKRRAG